MSSFLSNRESLFQGSKRAKADHNNLTKQLRDLNMTQDDLDDIALQAHLETQKRKSAEKRASEAQKGDPQSIEMATISMGESFNAKAKSAKLTRKQTKMPESERVARAFVWISDAVNKREPRDPKAGFRPWQLALLQLQQNTYYQLWTWSWILLHVAITFFEPPSNMNPGVYQKPDGYYYSSVRPIILSLDLYCVLCGFLHCFLEVCHKGKTFYQQRSSFVNVFVSVLLLADWLMEYFMNSNFIRFGRALRAGRLVSNSYHLRRYCRAMLATIPYLFDVLVLLLAFVLLFGIGGMHLFNNIYFKYDDTKWVTTEKLCTPDTIYTTDEETPMDLMVPLRDNFQDIFKSASSLLLTATLTNWPDVGRAAFSNSSTDTLFFVVFIFICLVVIMSIPVSVILESFKKYRRQQVLIDKLRERRTLLLAYDQMASFDGLVGFDMYCKVFERMYGKKNKKAVQARYLFRILDEDGDGTISVKEFFKLCEVMQYKIQDLQEAESIARKRCCGMWGRLSDCGTAIRNSMNRTIHLDTVVRSRLFSAISLWTVVLNTVVRGLFSSLYAWSALLVQQR